MAIGGGVRVGCAGRDAVLCVGCGGHLVVPRSTGATRHGLTLLVVGYLGSPAVLMILPLERAGGEDGLLGGQEVWTELGLRRESAVDGVSAGAEQGDWNETYIYTAKKDLIDLWQQASEA